MIRPSTRCLWLAGAALMLGVGLSMVGGLPATAIVFPMGAVIVAFVLDWIISRKAGGFELEADIDKEVLAGEAARLTLKLKSRSGSTRFPAAPTARLLVPEGFDGPDEVSFGKNESGTPVASAIYQAIRRGEWRLGELHLHWTSRLGLIDFLPVRQIDLLVRVVPNIRPVSSGAIDLELRSQLHGAKSLMFRGEGSEFHQLNEYVAGMDPRSIDWKQSARHKKMVAKEMRAERNHQIILALDNGELMRQQIDGLPRIDHAINAALSLAWAGLQSGDLAGLYSYDASPRQFIPPAPGQRTFALLRSRMAELSYRSVATNHTFALSHLHQRLKRRSLIVIFSDFADPMTAQLLLEHLSILNRHHVMIFVTLRDPGLHELARRQVGGFEDVANAVSAGALLAERRDVLNRIGAMGVTVIETDPGALTSRLVSAYLSIIARELI